MSRAMDELAINALYGCPGALYNSDVGKDLLMEVLEQYGLPAFTDDFVADLAARHRLKDEALGARSEAEHRRSLRTY